jgi:hypothetical protein
MCVRYFLLLLLLQCISAISYTKLFPLDYFLHISSIRFSSYELSECLCFYHCQSITLLEYAILTFALTHSSSTI